MKQPVTTSYNKLPRVSLTFGFTLIEIIVTISIIAVLTGIGVLNYTSAQTSGRDSTRQAHLRKIQNALELYYADAHSYPDFGNCDTGTWESLDSLEDSLVSGVSGKKYTGELAGDPTDGVSYLYCTFDNNRCYCLSANVEKADNAQVDGQCGGSSGYTSSHDSDGIDGYYLMCP